MNLRVSGYSKESLPVDIYCILLSDSVGACLSLEVVLRVPIGIYDDHGIGGSKIDSQTASTGRQKKTEIARSIRVERLHSHLGC